MKTNVYALPVLPGREDAIRSMCAELEGPRRVAARSLRDGAGIDREQVFLQQGPLGMLALVVWDTDDAPAAMQTLRTEPGDHAQWFRDQVADIHGAELATGELPIVEVGSDWHDKSWSFGHHESIALAFPIKPGMRDVALSFAHELMGTRHHDYEQTRHELGIVRQLMLTQSTPQGDAAVMYGEGAPGWFDRAFAETRSSDEPFYHWWRDRIGQFAVASLLEQPTPPAIERVLDLTVRVPAHV